MTFDSVKKCGQVSNSFNLKLYLNDKKSKRKTETLTEEDDYASVMLLKSSNYIVE